jgi:ABC-2 type transport system ATP-binding protein
VYARLYGLAQPRDAVDRALSSFAMLDRANQPAAELSKGLKQRVALARTLLHHPDVVLLDEPTAGLDPESARDVRELVLRLQSEGRTVLLSTHNLDEVERVATRVAVLRSRLIAVDTPAALRARVFGVRIRITLRQAETRFADALTAAGFSDVHANGSSLSIAVRDPEASTPGIVRTLVESGAAILSVVAEQPPLEEVYLRLLQETSS